MPRLVQNGAVLRCNQGVSPSSLVVLPNGSTSASEQPLATVMDFVPMTNILSFGMCRSQANPQVAAATTAAQGVLTPQPCVPVTTDPWSPGASIVTIDEKKALTDDSTCACKWAGTVSISDPGTTVQGE